MDYQHKKIKDVTPEELQQFLASLSGEEESQEQKDMLDITNKILEGKCAFRDVLGISDDQMEALYSIAYNFYNCGRYDDALKVFKGLCLFDQLEYKYWLGLGATLQITKKYEEAVKAYGMCMLFKSTDAKAPFHAGECYVALNDKENAINAFNSLIIMDQNKPENKPFVDKAKAILKLLEEADQKE